MPTDLKFFKDKLSASVNNAKNKTLTESDATDYINRIYKISSLNEYRTLTTELIKKGLNDLNISAEGGGRHREMNLKDIKELCKANQIKLSRVVDGKRVAYKKKELMTKLKRKKLL
jgi:hypothetical protein